MKPPATGPRAGNTAPSTPGLLTDLRRDGQLGWAMGLLGLITPVAFAVGLLAPSPITDAVAVWGILPMAVAMILVGLSQRQNAVARRTGRHAALFGAVHLVLLVAWAVVVHVVLHGTPQDVLERFGPGLSAIVLIPTFAYLVFVGPLLGVVLGVIALVVPVSSEKRARILGT